MIEQKLREALMTGNVLLDFEKVDGENRILVGTLATCTEEEQLSAINDDLVHVWDVDGSSWKTFKPSRLNSWQAV